MLGARTVVGSALVVVVGCTSNAGLNAALATGAMVAATVVARAVAQECFATCGPGTKCSPRSGLCIPTTEESPCADPDNCVPLPASGSVAATNEPFAPRDDKSNASDDCAGLCFDDERCIVVRGELTCVPQ